MKEKDYELVYSDITGVEIESKEEEYYPEEDYDIQSENGLYDDWGSWDDFFRDDPIDLVYEDFRLNTGFITNFDEKDLDCYIKTIEKYSLLKDSNEVWIGSPYQNHTNFGLYHCHKPNGEQGLSKFWKIYDEIKGDK